jgi:hypothetical protein
MGRMGVVAMIAVAPDARATHMLPITVRLDAARMCMVPTAAELVAPATAAPIT